MSSEGVAIYGTGFSGLEVLQETEVREDELKAWDLKYLENISLHFSRARATRNEEKGLGRAKKVLFGQIPFGTETKHRFFLLTSFFSCRISFHRFSAPRCICPSQVRQFVCACFYCVLDNVVDTRALWFVVAHVLLEYWHMDDLMGNLFSLFCPTWSAVLKTSARWFRIR